MNAESKWEAVLRHEDIKPGERVRLRHINGDIIHGTILSTMSTDTLRVDTRVDAPYIVRYWLDRGYTIERAVPVRVLPTRPGIYVSASDLVDEVPSDVKFYARQLGRWVTSGSYIDDREIPDDIVYVATEIDVEAAEKRVAELEERIEEASKYLRTRAGGYIDREVSADAIEILTGATK